MELKKFLDKAKVIKTKNILLALTSSILQLEENLIEISSSEKLINQLGEVLKDIFIFIGENKIEINNKELKDLDLDHWKDDIRTYKPVHPGMSTDVYLYSMRNALKHLLDEKDIKLIKVYSFELAIKTFLFIDFLDLSIDTILEIKVREFTKIKVTSGGENYG